MTDEQIIKALECCATDDGNDCFQCPYCNIFFESGNGGCINRCHKDALDLINHRKAEIENLKADNEMYQKVNCLIAGQRDSRDKEIEELQTQMEWLTGYNKNLLDANTALSGEIEICKSEAIKEFAERLKNKIWYSDLCNLERTITPEIITNLVKEMTEE